MSDIHLSGFLFNASGAALESATVEAFAKNTVTETGGTAAASTTTNSSGYYTMTVTSDNEYDVRITSGNSVRWRRFDDRVQMEEIEVSVLNIREGATAQVYTIAPGSISADRTLTLPAATGNDTLASLGLAQTFSAAQTFTGAVTVGSDGSGADVIFYSGTAGDNLTWDASEELLTITGTNGATALNVADGNVTIADNLTVSGNLTVTGTTTSVDSTTINAASAFVFEGATANCYETTLAITDPTADRTIYLPNQSGYLPVLASASTTQVGSTPEELNFLDGSAKSTSSITICDADAFIVIDGTTTKQIPASDITTYVGAGTMSSFQLEDDDGTEVAISNAKEVKIIGSGVTTNWTDTDNGTDGDPYDLTITVDAAQTGITSVYNASLKVGRDSGNLIDFATTDNKLIFRVECVNEVELVQNALSPVTSDGVALGTGSLMWSDAFLASGSVINFNNGDITLTHSACTLTVAGGTLAAAAITGTTIDASTDFTIGTTVITDDVITFTPTSSDTVVMTATTHGAFSIVTTDDNAAAANITITADGTVEIDSAGNMTLDSGADVEINADGGCVNFKDGSLALAAIVNTSCVGELRIHEAANYVGFKAPALCGNQIWTLPAAVASCACDVLTCNGSGVLSWATAGGGLNSCANAIINNGYGIALGTSQLAAGDNPGNVVAEFQMAGTADADTAIHLIRHSADAATASIKFAKSRNATIGSHTVVADDDVVGTISWHGCDGGDFIPRVAEMRGVVDGSPGTNDMPGRLEFYTTAAGAQDPTLAMTINNAGIITKPLQPAMLAYNSSTDSNVSGACTVITIDFDTELYDQNADFACDVFTAPVTGRYLVAGHVAVLGVTDAGTNTDLRIFESDRKYHTIQNTVGDAGGGRQSFPFSTIVPMTAGNTVRIQYGASSESSDVHDITGEATDNQTYLSIQLLA